MTTIDNRIHLLDDISQSQIKSSVQILSLSDVVLELVKNALDAQASNIKVTLNYPHGFCSVLDNGFGIPTPEFEADGGLGKPFHTSKTGRTHETYGRHGRYLAALSALSLLSIASRVNGDHTDVLWLDDSGRLRHTTESPDTIQVETGTRVKVYGLFSRLPVRSKSLNDRFTNSSEVQKEFQRLKHNVLGLVLAIPTPFSIVVEHSYPKHLYQYKPYIQSTIPSGLDFHKNSLYVHSAIRQTGYVDASQAYQWQDTSIHSGDISLHGLISNLPAPHRSVQYLSLNHLPLLKSATPELYQRINALFENSTFGSLSDTDTARCEHQPRKRFSSNLKGVDKWPMFVIWIKTTSVSVYESLHGAVMSTEAEKFLPRVASLLQTLVEEFLTLHGHKKSIKERRSRQLELKRDGRASRSSSVNKERDQAHESFRYWSRVKSSRASVMDDILTGLPFHGKPGANQTNTLLITRNSLPLSDGSVSSIMSGKLAAPGLLPGSNYGDEDQGHVLWTDPQTGRILRLDSRTGMELPRTLTLDEAETRERGNMAIKQPSGGHVQDLTLTQVARNISRRSKCVPIIQDQPIRSIGLFTYDGGDPEQSSSTCKRKTESFWTATGHCDIRHAMQLETPSISRKALRSAKVLRQVDRKFILALVQEQSPSFSAVSSETSSTQLILIDQHAADERCKVEALLKSIHKGESTVLTVPITLEIPKQEIQPFHSTRSYFAQWGIHYDLITRQQEKTHRLHQIQVTALPTVIAERCRLHPKLIIDILRQEIWSENNHTLPIKSTQPAKHSSLPHTYLPPRLLDLLNSRACRSAIMFNDDLSPTQCQNLLESLATCTLPFQCAHGRPSMVVLTDIHKLNHERPLAPPPATTSLYFATKHAQRVKGNMSHPGQPPDEAETETETGTANPRSGHSPHPKHRSTTNQPHVHETPQPDTHHTTLSQLSFASAYQTWLDSKEQNQPHCSSPM